MSGLDKLFDELDSDLTWRKKEVLNLFSMLNDSNSNLLLKICVLLLYSHWEGYVKNASKRYLLFVAKKKIKVELLTDNFKAICLKGYAKNVYESRNSLTLSNEIKLLSLISGSEEKVFKLLGTFLNEKNGSDIIDTAGNLSYEIFNNIMRVVGIEEKACIKTKSHYIDSNLLKNRNKVAHGNKSKLFKDDDNEFELDAAEFDTLKKVIFCLLDNLSGELKTHAENNFYLYEKMKEKILFSKKSQQDLKKNLSSILI